MEIMSTQFSRDFILEIQKGNVPGHKIWTAFGEREGMGASGAIRTSGEDVWRGNDSGVGGAVFIPSPSLSGEQFEVNSSSADDMPSGTLTFTGQPLDTETVTIGTKTYTYQTTLTDIDGNVLIGATVAESIDNLVCAMIGGPATGAGTKYAAAMTAQPEGINSAAGSVNTMVFSIDTGTPTSTETLTNASFGSANFLNKDGVPAVEILYLDADGAEQKETINLNGTTLVTSLVTTGIFVNDFHAVSSLRNSTADGNLDVRKAGGATTDIYNMIGVGGNKSVVPRRMVPAGKTLYLQGWRGYEVQSKRQIYRIRATAYDGARSVPWSYHFKDTMYLKLDSSGDVDVHATLPEMTIITISGWADQSAGEGSVSWWGVLVDD